MHLLKKLINATFISKQMVKLNIGCGEKKLPGFINIDIEKKYKPELCFNISDISEYSRFTNDSVELIRASHILEHTNNPEEIMKEWHRMLKPDGIVVLRMPHFSRGFTNPTHQRGFDLSWPLHFEKDNKYSTYAGVNYRLINTKLRWIAFLEHYPCGIATKDGLGLLNTVINALANLNPYFCTRVWCFWVGGFEEMELQFKKI